MSAGATVSFAAGLATAVVVEVVVLVRGYLGVHPSNVAGHVALVWAVSALAGATIGVRLVKRRPHVGEMPSGSLGKRPLRRRV